MSSNRKVVGKLVAVQKLNKVRYKFVKSKVVRIDPNEFYTAIVYSKNFK